MIDRYQLGLSTAYHWRQPNWLSPGLSTSVSPGLSPSTPLPSQLASTSAWRHPNITAPDPPAGLDSGIKQKDKKMYSKRSPAKSGIMYQCHRQATITWQQPDRLAGIIDVM